MVNLGFNLASFLAQVYFGPNSATLLGIILVVLGFVLPFVRRVPARFHDIFFSLAAVLDGFLLFFQGWRLDPILQFGQLLLASVAIFYTVESIRLRRVNRP